MGREILVIGDRIRDIYLKGPVDTANEGDCPRITGDQFEIRRGGAVFVKDAIASFSGSEDISCHGTSSSDIYRFVDNASGKTILAADVFAESYGFDANRHIAVQYDAVIIWDDNRTKRWGQIESVCSNALVIVDSINIKQWDKPWVNYIKMTESDWDGTYPLHGATLITTSADGVWLPRSGEAYPGAFFPVKTIKNPLDVCGAGDVFTAVFVTKLLEEASEAKAIIEAIYYSRESTKYFGCHIPTREKA